MPISETEKIIQGGAPSLSINKLKTTDAAFGLESKASSMAAFLDVVWNFKEVDFYRATRIVAHPFTPL